MRALIEHSVTRISKSHETHTLNPGHIYQYRGLVRAGLAEALLCDLGMYILLRKICARSVGRDVV